MSEFSPRHLFEKVELNQIKEIKIDLASQEVRVENRLDLYKLFSALKLVTFKKNENNQISLDSDGVPIISEASQKVKFINSFDQSSPFYRYPLVAKVGYKDGWTIMGSIVKARPGVPET